MYKKQQQKKHEKGERGRTHKRKKNIHTNK